MNKMTKAKVAKVVMEYPIKKAETDGEREMILEVNISQGTSHLILLYTMTIQLTFAYCQQLIKLVEELTGRHNSEDTQAKTPDNSGYTLSAIQAKLAALGKAAGGANGSAKLQQGLKVVEARMMATYDSDTSINTLTKLGPSPEEMEATKNEVKKFLLELLQDPDFRCDGSIYIIYVYMHMRFSIHGYIHILFTFVQCC